MFLQASAILSTGGVGCSRFCSNFGGCSRFCSNYFLGGRGVPPNFRGGCSSKLSGGVPPNFQEGVPLNFWGGGSPPEYGQRSASTHPTGMHSFFSDNHPKTISESVRSECSSYRMVFSTSHILDFLKKTNSFPLTWAVAFKLWDSTF